MFAKVKVTMLLFAASSILNLGYSQAGDQGNLHFQVEYGLDLFNTSNNWDFKAPSLTGGTDINFALQYNTHKRVGLKVELSQIDYIIDSSNVDGYLNIRGLGVGLNYYLKNRNKFSLQIGADIGVFNLDYQRDLLDSNGSIDNVSLFAKGYYQKMYLNASTYFGNKHQLGIGLKFGIMNAPYRWNEFQVNDIDVEELLGKRTTDIITSQIGLFGHISLTYYLRMKKDI